MQRNDVKGSALKKHKNLQKTNPKRFNQEIELIIQYLNRQVGYEKSLLNERAYSLYLSENINYEDAADLSYKQFTKKELLKYNQPLGEINEQWMELEVIVHDFLWIPQDAMESFIIACYKDICSGYGIHAVLEHMGIHEIDLLLLHSCELWKTLMQIIMETRLPMLNGYSRLEYQNMTGKDAFSIGVFQEELLEDDVETETPLYAMPVSVQEMIYHALSDHRGADQIQALEQVTRRKEYWKIKRKIVFMHCQFSDCVL